MNDFVYNFILENEYISIFVLMMVFASELVMPFVGYAASLGHFSLPLAVAAGTAGSTLWSIMMYFLARHFRQKAVYRFVRRHGKWLGVKVRDLDRAGRWFDRNARVTVFAGKFVPGVRTAVSLSAGFRQMPFLVYVACTFLGTTVSSLLLAAIGYSVKDNYANVSIFLSNLSTAVVVLLVGMVLIFILWRRRQRG